MATYTFRPNFEVLALATGVLDGGPLWAALAVRMAEALLDRAENGHAFSKVVGS